MKQTFLFLILLLIASCAPARITKDTSIHFPGSHTKKYHVVEKGDSLWGISKRYGISIDTLLKGNSISSPRNLKVGQKILIPAHYSRRSGPFLWPVNGEVINFFNENVDNAINKGLNIKVNSGDKNIIASADGKVIFSNDLKGWGKTIILQHPSNVYTVYANLNCILIKEGSFVKKKQVIGEVACGKNNNHILHFEIRKKYIPQNPLNYLN